jgi:acyl carrier protein
MGLGHPAERVDLHTRVRNFISDELLFGEAELTESTDILTLLDSLGLMQLVTFIDEDLQVQIREGDIVPENFRTIRDVERLLDERASRS